MIKQYPLTIAAGETGTLQVLGNFFRFRSCNDQQAEIKVIAENQQGLPVVDAQLLAGQGINGAQEFKNLRITNTSAASINCVFVIGSGAFEDDRVNGQVQTQISGLFNPLADLTLDGTVQTIAGNAARTNIAIMAPATNSGVVTIGQTGQGIPLPQGGSFVLPTTAAVTVQGTNGDKIHLVEV